MKAKARHALEWIFEPLEDHPDFLRKAMFGCQAAYFKGKLCLAVAAGKEPWNGLLVCTAREHHLSLLKDFTPLRPHAILGKWLYLSQSDPEFEETSLKLVERVLRTDERIGVESKPKKIKSTKKSKAS